MNKHQAQAITQMGQARHEYNRGVLSMLGHDNLALDHSVVCASIDILVKQRDTLIAASMPDGENLFAHLLAPMPPDAAKIQQKIDEQSARENKLWAQVDALIAEAREYLERLDPMGLDQAV